MIRIFYFASLRERLGTAQESLPLPAGVETLAQLRDHLAARGEPWQALVQTRNLRAAVNQAMAHAETPVQDGDEVAFFPPVTGG